MTVVIITNQSNKNEQDSKSIESMLQTSQDQCLPVFEEPQQTHSPFFPHMYYAKGVDDSLCALNVFFACIIIWVSDLMLVFI